MTQLSDNLTALRELKGWTVPQVHIALNSAGIEVAFSTVAGWFNGSREVGSMKHLKALCEVLDTDMNTLTGDSIAVAQGKVEVQVQMELRDMDEAQKELVLALVRNMRGGPK